MRIEYSTLRFIIQCLRWILIVRLFDVFCFLDWNVEISTLIFVMLNFQRWLFDVVKHSTLVFWSCWIFNFDFLCMLNWNTSFFMYWIFNIAFSVGWIFIQLFAFGIEMLNVNICMLLVCMYVCFLCLSSGVGSTFLYFFHVSNFHILKICQKN